MIVNLHVSITNSKNNCDSKPTHEKMKLSRNYLAKKVNQVPLPSSRESNIHPDIYQKHPEVPANISFMVP